MTPEAATAGGETVQLDARGLNCPMPIVRTAQTIKTLAPGQLQRDRDQRRAGRRLPLCPAPKVRHHR